MTLLETTTSAAAFVATYIARHAGSARQWAAAACRRAGRSDRHQ
ncbi:hypothetical protein [Krasilnikovia sp. MM14-A1259]